MIQIIFVIMALCTNNVHAFLAYDTAASLMEQGRWDEAKQQLQKLLVEKPDAPDVLYDAGVAWYKTKDYKQARAYFNRVTQLPQTKVQLKEQAHFNAGNAAAALKEYEDAIKHYETVLNINSSNEKAKHNLEKIKQLMQQKQEQQNQKDSKEDKDQKEDKSSDAQKQMDDENKKEHEENSGQDTKDQGKSQSSQDRQQQEKGDQKQQGADADQSDGRKDSQDNQGQQADKSKQEKEGHENSPGQQNDTKQHSQSTGAKEKDQEQANGGTYGDPNNLQQKLDARLVQLLDAQEKKDASLNKRMINVAVGQSMGGSQGENCW